MNIDLYGLILALPAILLALSVHEYSHGKVASILGDPTPGFMGRLTLDPRAHIDPFGLLFLIITQRFGWAKPVIVNPDYFKDRRKGMMLVGLAGPVSNLILAFLVSLILRVWAWADPYLWVKLYRGILGSYPQIFFDLLWNMFLINISLAVFNLLPIPPLDGSKILAGILPRKHAHFIDNLEGGLGMVILLFLVMTNMLGTILYPLINFVRGIFLMGM
ncbi:MAG: site-2 protease family protein [Halanaerobiales bacterium]|nr:site-2 protease family protein [Halanaerobiales bacterium]